MATKAQIQTKINTINDGGNNTASEVRGVLGTDPESLLENVYGSQVSDNETTQTYTSSSSIFDYTINLFKVGNNITITGRIKANNALSSSSVIFNITNNEFLQENARYNCLGQKINSSDTLPIYLIGDELKIGASVFTDEIYYFTITYKSLN